jgi:hypothetical protein
MKRIVSKHAHAPRWQRQGADWHLVAGGHRFACISRDGKRWLCWRTEDIGDDGLIGFMPSLAAAKAYLGRRVQFAMLPTHAREEPPL